MEFAGGLLVILGVAMLFAGAYEPLGYAAIVLGVALFVYAWRSNVHVQSKKTIDRDQEYDDEGEAKRQGIPYVKDTFHGGH